MLKHSNNSPVVLKNKDLGGLPPNRKASSKPISLKRKDVMFENSDMKRKGSVIARNDEDKSPMTHDKDRSNNNILLLSRSDTPLNHNNQVNNSVILNTVSKSVFLCQNQHNFTNKCQQPKTSTQGPVIVESNSFIDCAPETSISEPINLSMKSKDILSLTGTPGYTKQDKIISPRQTFSSRKSPNSFMTQAEKMLSHSVSITPIVRIDDQDNDEDKDPLALEDGDARLDIDDDEDSYLQNISRGIVEVKLESNVQDDRVSFSCPKCNRSYAEKHLCELHMRTVHYASKTKEKCDICGVRFINLKAHKEKYHFFLDVDKCNLCGKVIDVPFVFFSIFLLFSISSF